MAPAATSAGLVQSNSRSSAFNQGLPFVAQENQTWYLFAVMLKRVWLAKLSSRHHNQPWKPSALLRIQVRTLSYKWPTRQYRYNVALETQWDSWSHRDTQQKMRQSHTPATDSTSVYSMEDNQSSPTIASSSAHSTSCEPASSSRSSPGTSSGATGRKRIAPNSITPNACTNCKKARAKVRYYIQVYTLMTEIMLIKFQCDGTGPTCRRCGNRTLLDPC